MASAAAAMNSQAEQTGTKGRIYNMEGFGSNGMMRPGLTLYGTSKYAVGYLSRSLDKECRAAGWGVRVGTISPGMVLTDLLKGGIPQDPAEAAQTKKIFAILADPVERVAP